MTGVGYGIALLVVFVLGMLVNDLHHMRRIKERERLEALRGVQIIVCEKDRLGDTLTDVLRKSETPAPAAGLPAKFGQDLQRTGRARAARVGGRWI